MPFSTKLSADRAEVGDPFTSTEIDAVAANAAIRVVQSSAPLSAASWRRLDEELLARRPDIQLRVYGFYGNTCDLSFVGQMKHVRRFAADSLQRATGVESIAALQRLEALSLGVFDLDSFEVLEHVSDGLKELFLSATRSKKPDLRPVRRFRGLRTLYLEGQQRSIDVIADLAALEDLTLRSISTPDLSYAAALPRLTSLDLKLGGIKDLTAIARLAALRYLEIWQVRGLADIGVVSELHRLQNLFLQSLPGVKALPPSRPMRGAPAHRGAEHARTARLLRGRTRAGARGVLDRAGGRQSAGGSRAGAAESDAAPSGWALRERSQEPRVRDDGGRERQGSIRGDRVRVPVDDRAVGRVGLKPTRREALRSRTASPPRRACA
jgi:hypothetical protein